MEIYNKKALPIQMSKLLAAMEGSLILFPSKNELDIKTYLGFFLPHTLYLHLNKAIRISLHNIPDTT